MQSERKFCDYVFVQGKKKGQVCGVYIKKGVGQKCASHSRPKCMHGKRKYYCVECAGNSTCEHKRIKSVCHECRGSSICPHDKVKSVCVQCAGGSICLHNKVRSKCRECDGSEFCVHNKWKYICVDCAGTGTCEHKKIKRQCNVCDPIGHLKQKASDCVRNALGRDKKEKTLTYVGCSVEDLRSHLEGQFQEGMTWDNYGEWEIDHVVPIKYENPSLEQVIERLHYTNLQPMWAAENRSKCNRFIGRKEKND